MIQHPKGLQLEIVGLELSKFGCSCEAHDVCGSVVQLDTVLQLQNEQVLNGMYEILMYMHCTSYNSHILLYL